MRGVRRNDNLGKGKGGEAKEGKQKHSALPCHKGRPIKPI